MDKNVGSTDRRVRTAIGAIVGTLSLATLIGVVPLPAIVAPVLGIVAIAALGTAATGTCGLYSLIGVDTCRVRSDR